MVNPDISKTVAIAEQYAQIWVERTIFDKPKGSASYSERCFLVSRKAGSIRRDSVEHILNECEVVIGNQDRIWIQGNSNRL